MTQSLSPSQYKAMTQKRGSKYGNRKCWLDGRKFDSKAERDRYATLKLRGRAGEIVGLDCQREFKLLVNGFSVGSYFADFAYWDNARDQFVIEDVKGAPATAVFKLKAKIVKALYGVDVEIIR